MKFNPIEDRVIIKVLEDDSTTSGGVILPNMGTENITGLGEVLAVGPGLNSLVSGTRCKMQCKVGDTVFYPKNMIKYIEIAGEEYHIIKECELLTIVKEDK